MKCRTLFWVIFFTGAILVTEPGRTYAGEGNFSDYMGEIGTKFGRGLFNVLSSPAEIPCRTSAAVKEGGGWNSIPGFGQGVVYMLRRMLVGVTEAGTFMIPMEATLPVVCSKNPEPRIA